jgi:hypothetical protein
MSIPRCSRLAVARSCAVACVFLALAANRVQAQDAAPAEAAQTPAAPANGAVFVDPAGFVLFGPTLGAEVALGRYSLVAYGRWLNAGLMAKSLFESATDKFTFSYGGGLKGRYYFGEGLLGPHVGVAVEALKTRTESHTDKIATNNVVVVPEIEGGYRVGFGRFFAGAALGIGYVVQASRSIDDIDGGNHAKDFDAKDYSTLYGTASLDLGLFF